jgi:hypothetical protein
MKILSRDTMSFVLADWLARNVKVLLSLTPVPCLLWAQEKYETPRLRICHRPAQQS